MSNVYKVYQVINSVNEKTYIGQTTLSIQRRWNSHVYEARRSPKTALHLAMSKYGVDKFEILLIDDTAKSLEELNQLEVFYIRKLKTISPHGYNIDEGGKNRKLTEVTKQKLREKALLRPPSRIGIPMSEDTKQKLRRANLGKVTPEEVKEKIRSSMVRTRQAHPEKWVMTDKERLRLRELNVGRKRTIESRQKQSETAKKKGYRPPSTKGLFRSEEYRQKMRENMLRIWQERKRNAL